MTDQTRSAPVDENTLVAAVVGCVLNEVRFTIGHGDLRTAEQRELLARKVDLVHNAAEWFTNPRITSPLAELRRYAEWNNLSEYCERLLAQE